MIGQFARGEVEIFLFASCWLSNCSLTIRCRAHSINVIALVPMVGTGLGSYFILSSQQSYRLARSRSHNLSEVFNGLHLHELKSELGHYIALSH